MKKIGKWPICAMLALSVVLFSACPGENGAVEVADVPFGTVPAVLPRDQTLFFGGQQWGTPGGNNPFMFTPNNTMVMEMPNVGSNRTLVFETLYMFNMLDGQLHPLLASGPYRWNSDMSVLSVDINPNARWNNGTPVTARDVVATFDMHTRLNTAWGTAYSPFISSVTAPSNLTAEFHLNMANFNPQRVLEWLGRVLITSEAFKNERMAYHNNNIEAFRSDPWPWQILVHSGPYAPTLLSSTMVLLERDDNYWGQHPSMWGRLPVPRYLAHNIFTSNDVKRAAFARGEIDFNQQFLVNVSDLWNVDGLPISTFLREAPYHMPGTMPSIWFNTRRPGLDQRAVRQAIAYATDFEQIISAAMSGQSPTFAQAPRSIALPTDGEQRFVDNAALSHLQWANRDIARANAVLDAAGIVDTTGNGIRDWQGQDLSFTLMCPMGWSDWEAALEIVAAAGADIGINLSTQFVDMPVWEEARQTGNFDIIMFSMTATAISAPWSRAFHALHVENPNAERVFWAYHRMYTPEMNALIMRAASETNEAVLRQYFTQISYFLLEEMPVVALMYRPWFFHTVESVWTGFPELGDGTNIPPQVLKNGLGIAALYNLRLVN